MDKDELLLKYNKDYLDIINSDSYKLGYNLVYIAKQIRKGHFRNVFHVINDKVISIKIRKISRKKYVNITEYSEVPDKRVAVYTAIFGNYDYLKEPRYVDPRCDYYVFTDNKIDTNSIWKTIDCSILNAYDKSYRYKNRYCKMHPFQLFNEYDYVIYIDGNFEICGPVSELIKYINPKTNLAVHNMFNRDCVYDEAKACKLLKKGDYKKINKEIEEYKKEGFPRHFGMYECPIIVSKKSELSSVLFEQWWQRYIDSGERDQIIMPYLIWKNGFSFLDVGIIGNDVRRNCYFRKKEHGLL